MSISVLDARELLGETGKSMTNKEIASLNNRLFALVSQIVDNNITLFQSCKKQ